MTVAKNVPMGQQTKFLKKINYFFLNTHIEKGVRKVEINVKTALDFFFQFNFALNLKKKYIRKELVHFM